jgi:hypothetical protein
VGAAGSTRAWEGDARCIGGSGLNTGARTWAGGASSREGVLGTFHRRVVGGPSIVRTTASSICM